jgi:hypothetical protein
MKYSQMVSAIFLGRYATTTIYNIPRTNSTCAFYAEESDGSEPGNTDDISPDLSMVVTVGDAISTIGTEMAELDEIDFDEKLNL